MRQTNWLTWLTEAPTLPLTLVLNSLADPDPVKFLYANDWVDEAFPLYHQTPLQSMIGQSAWLLRPKTTAIHQIAKVFDMGLLSRWGWAYRSDWAWKDQIAHWRSRLLIEIEGQRAIFRWQDSRIMSLLQPAFDVNDWRELLTPVEQLAVEGEHIYCSSRPEGEKKEQGEVYTLGKHLLDVWNSSDQALSQKAFHLETALWEAHGEEAQYCYEQIGELTPHIIDFLKSHRDMGFYLGALNTKDVLEALHKSIGDRL